MPRRVALILLPLALLAACGDDDSANETSASRPSGDGEAAADRAPADDDADLQLSAVELPEGQRVDLGRDIVFTATVSAEVEDLTAALATATKAAEAEGGFVFAQDVQAGNPPRATMTLKVPSARFRAAYDAVAAIGTPTGQHFAAEDVSADVVDLEARRTTVAASVDRLRGFLANAADIGQITALEGELVRREAELESLQGQLRVLDDRTTLGTIDVSFAGPAGVAAAVAPLEPEPPLGFTDGLRGSVRLLGFLARVATLLVGLSLPFLPFVVAPAVAWVLIRRRRSVPQPPLAG